ncbi:MAG: hypothetical protein RBR14_05775 [Candidatus Cloacimonas acidaminovorans]|nr:hypothetical protein [Candidatus Cloacimonas acidaminovorans]
MEKIEYIFSEDDLLSLSALIKYAEKNGVLEKERLQIIKTFNEPAFKILNNGIKILNNK